MAALASGRPFNITTGADNYGNGSSGDRPVVNGSVIARNAGRGTPVYHLQTFVKRRFSLPGDRAQLSVRAEAFNLLNHSNIVERNGAYGNDPTGVPISTFGQPLGGINSVDPARQFQFIARLRF